MTNHFYGTMLTSPFYVYRDEAMARSCAQDCKTPHHVVDDMAGRFVVATPEDAQRLVADGYTLIASW
jgi:hypothetical protein